jgi:hypothetical protein
MIRYAIFVIILLLGCKDSQQKTIASKKTEVVLDSLSGQDSGNQYSINERTIPPKNMDIFHFLESLKWERGSDSSGYDSNKTPKWDIPLLITDISDNGVLFIDPNDNFTRTIEKKEIERELNNRKGKSYEMISHCTYTYSIRFKQYSDLKFKENEKEEVTVNIGSGYELTFETKQNRHYLIKCEYLDLEGE